MTGVSLGGGRTLRPLTALELLQARREAAGLAKDRRERALCDNACLLARALEDEESKTPVYPDGTAVLAWTSCVPTAGAGRWRSAARRAAGSRPAGRRPPIPPLTPDGFWR